MKQFFTRILVVGLALLTLCPANADQIVYGNGIRRNYTKYLPADLGENRPLLISMHGMNQDPGYQAGMLQIESVADTAKFLTIFPEGIDRGWDIGGQRDIQFVLALIDEMERLYKIDRNRVYLSGFSMGGMFTYHAMNYIADKIAAFAPISGYPMGGQPFTSSRPVPIIHTHGTSDDVVTYDRVQSSLDGWIERNGCSPTPQVTYGYRYNGCDRYQWGPGDDGVEVVHIKRYDKGHWIANDYFKTGEEIWNFCKRYSLNDNKPTVKLNSPTDGINYHGIGRTVKFDINVDVDATSEVSEIAKVNVYGDGELVTTLTEAPYVCEWKDLAKGQHFLRVEAVDARGVACSRALSFELNGYRTAFSLSDNFKQEGTIPAGWILSNGRTSRPGYQEGLTGGPRVIAFTGTPHDFNYGLYTANLSGKEDGGYMVFGAENTNTRVVLTPGTYQFVYRVANYNCPTFSPVRCKIINIETGEVLAEEEVTPNVNIGNNAANPFSNVESHTIDLVINEKVYVKILFYTDNAKKADAVLGYASLKQKSANGLNDIEASDAQVVDVKYYDFMGREIRQPRGAVIRSMRLSDGTVKNEKIIIR